MLVLDPLGECTISVSLSGVDKQKHYLYYLLLAMPFFVVGDAIISPEEVKSRHSRLTSDSFQSYLLVLVMRIG